MGLLGVTCSGMRVGSASHLDETGWLKMVR